MSEPLLDAVLEAPEAERREVLAAALGRRLGELLGVPAASLDAGRPLAGLGLDSLLAVDLKGWIEAELGVTQQLGTLLECDLGRLAARLLDGLAQDGSGRPALDAADALAAAADGDGADGADGPDSGEVPLSHGQKALWFLERLAPESGAYHLAGAARVAGALDLAALTRALRALVARHAALRTTFAARGGRLVQRVHSRLEPELRSEELAAPGTEALGAWLRAEALRPFDFEQGPLLRLCVARQPGQTTLLLAVHHLVADFWSLAVLVSELGEAYAREAVGDGAAWQPAPLAGSYAAWTRWQERMLAGPRGEALWQYWRDRLGPGLPDLDLPADRPRPPVQTFRGGAVALGLGAEELAALRGLAARHDATLFTVLLGAFQALLSRTTHQLDFAVGAPSSGRGRRWMEPLAGYFVNPLVLRAELGGNPSGEELLARARATVLPAFAHQDYPFALLAERLKPVRDASRPPLVQVMLNFLREPPGTVEGLAAFAAGHPGTRLRAGGLELELVPLELPAAQLELLLTAAEGGGRLALWLQYNGDLFDRETAAGMLRHLRTLLAGLAADPGCRLDDLPLLDDTERRQLLFETNRSAMDWPQTACVHELVAAQAERTPEAVALTFRDHDLTYRELGARAAAIAGALGRLGVVAGETVAVLLDRSPEMVAALLAVLGAGAAYLPLDPSYPDERIAAMLDDSGARWVLGDGRQASRPLRFAGRWLRLDAPPLAAAAGAAGATGGAVDAAAPPPVSSDHPAYLIYTSGSTGRPKGVVVPHRAVVNFFAGMDRAVGCGPGDVLLAVTSISFDISVLELFWTLARGARVVLLEDGPASGTAPAADPPHRQRRPDPSRRPGISARSGRSGRLERGRPPRAMDFSLFYFSGDGTGTGSRKYRLLLDGARFADRAGLTAVWTPERHFHAFGGLFPNPAVTAAALATATERVAIRAGSVVLPLHHPLRVAEDWSVIDNLSGGRVAIAFASGWHADDFVFYPDKYEARKELMFRDLETVRRLWRGEPLRLAGGGGEAEVRVLPRPLQPELPVWITSGGSEETFVRAGEIGANVLTHLLGQTLDEVAAKTRRYREARAAAGHDPDTGIVTLMLHTFLDASPEAARARVRGPFVEYLRTSLGLIHTLVRRLGLPVDLDRLSPRDLDDLLAFACERYQTSALFGDPASCQRLVADLLDIGVDEVACLIDFGVAEDEVLASLPRLAELMRLGRAAAAPTGMSSGDGSAGAPQTSPAEAPSQRAGTSYGSLARQAARLRPTLLQCTPSRMQLLLCDGETAGALGSLRALLLGGEALPPALAREVKASLPARLVNVYGPTETTVWSAAAEVGELPEGAAVPIGGPLANTEIYLLDPRGEPVPAGVTGGLYIGGQGVARGYHRAPAQTAERFLPDPWSGRPGARLYRTGDLARRRRDGAIEFLGRADRQVKLRGFRVELGEIEAACVEHPAVREAAVLVRQMGGEQQVLVAYLAAGGGPRFGPGSESRPAPPEEVRQFLRTRLPDYMVPAGCVWLDALPRTANGKLDRNALPAWQGSRPEAAVFVSPATQLERRLAAIWSEVLQIHKVGADDNFFDLGGHSLLMAQVHNRLTEQLAIELPLVKLLEHPTVRSLARHLAQQEQEGGFSAAASRERARLQQAGRRRRQERAAAKAVVS
jgi:natural product biosynthesis luciferase-like monooxygenase protein